MARQTSQVLRNASFTEVEAFGEWLAKFLLVGENLGLPRFTYNDSSMFILPVYFLVDAAKNNVTEVKINSSSNVLILCEVEIFGECPAGTYTTTDLQCTNCPATCPNSCHRDSGSCSVCKGYSNPPACTAACTNGQWGVNCTKSCSVNCYGQSCDKTTGVCDNGCQGFSDPPNCTTECAQGNWGPNCQFNCGNNCFNLSCDSQTGKCDNGCDGFMDPPDCTVECKVGKWGRNCVDECSSQCRNHSCDRVTGLCLYTCDSLTDLSCPAGLASQTSELTFLSGVGIGIAVGAVVIILIVVGVVAVRRTRITTLRNSSQDDIKPEIRPQTYESVKQINTDEHSYEPSRSSLETRVEFR